MTLKKIFNRLCVGLAVWACLMVAVILCVLVYVCWKQMVCAIIVILVVTAIFRGINILLDGDW